MPARQLALALLALGACGDSSPPEFADPRTIEVAKFSLTPGRKLDLLFMIDDTDADSQAELANHLSKLFDRLAAIDGGMPDLHIGVATTDLGTTGRNDPANPGPPIGQLGNGGCAGQGKDGVLQTSGAAVTGSFLVDEGVPGSRQQNYTGELVAVVGQMIQAGAGGCGFEQPLAATTRALTNPLNAGFLRADAHLGIVMLGDEDDCSFKDPAVLSAESPQLGAQQSFRCTRFGLVCDEDTNTVGPKHHCRADEDSALLTGVEGYTRFLEAVRPGEGAMVGAIVGPPSPVVVELRTPPGGGNAIPGLGHVCSGSPTLHVADPAVRIAQTVRGLGGHGVLTSFCELSLGVPVTQIAQGMVQLFGVACLDTSVLRDSDTAEGIQPTCTVTVGRGGVETPVPMCPADGGCFEIVVDAVACGASSDHLRLVVHDPTPSSDALVRARCELP